MKQICVDTAAGLVVILAILTAATEKGLVESLVGGSAGGDGDGGGGCIHRNRCLRVKAAFAGSLKFPANKAFATRAAIMAALVVVVGLVVGVVVVKVVARFRSELQPR